MPKAPVLPGPFFVRDRVGNCEIDDPPGSCRFHSQPEADYISDSALTPTVIAPIGSPVAGSVSVNEICAW